MISLIRKAELDLLAAKLLYKRKDYSNSLFLFQQAVEKAYKAAGIKTGQISINDLTVVGHNFLKMLKISLKPISNNNIVEISNWWQDSIKSEENITEEQLTEITPSDRQFFFQLNETEISNLLKQITHYKKNIKKTLNKPEGIKMLLQLAKESGRFSALELEAIYQENSNEIANSDTNEISDYLGHVFALQILGLITTAHSEQTRYPFTNKNDYSVKCPIEIYTQDMPLIKNLTKLFRIANKAIKSLKSEY